MLEVLLEKVKKFFVDPSAGYFPRFVSPYLAAASPRPAPVWNDLARINELWEKRRGEPTRRLGNAQEALALLDSCERVFPEHIERIKSPFTKIVYVLPFHWVRESLARLPPGQVVGDPDRVSRLFDGRVSIGFAVEEEPNSGLTRSLIEGLDHSVVVVSHEGCILAACPMEIHRMEWRRGIMIC